MMRFVVDDDEDEDDEADDVSLPMFHSCSYGRRRWCGVAPAEADDDTTSLRRYNSRRIISVASSLFCCSTVEFDDAVVIEGELIGGYEKYLQTRASSVCSL